MLSDGQLKDLVRQKKITIEPYDERYARAGRYDVRLGRTILVPEPTNAVLDPMDPTVEPQYSEVDLTTTEFALQPKQFVLGQTLETIGLDASIGMLIDGSSTLARLGVSIHQSSTFIPPGQDPHIITLEIYNAGIWQVRLSYQMRIGKLLAFRYAQTNITEQRSFNVYNGQAQTRGAKFCSSE